VVVLLILLLLGGYAAFTATHHTLLALTCLAHALLLIHPIRCAVLFCLGLVGTAVVAAVQLVLPDRRRDSEPLVAGPPPPSRAPERPSTAAPDWSAPDHHGQLPPPSPRVSWFRR
jgi:hypothetical protein